MKRMKCGTTWGVMAGLLLVVFAAPAMAQSSLGPNFTWDTPGDLEGWQGNPGTPVTATVDDGALVFHYPQGVGNNAGAANFWVVYDLAIDADTYTQCTLEYETVDWPAAGNEEGLIYCLLWFGDGARWNAVWVTVDPAATGVQTFTQDMTNPASWIFEPDESFYCPWSGTVECLGLEFPIWWNAACTPTSNWIDSQTKFHFLQFTQVEQPSETETEIVASIAEGWIEEGLHFTLTAPQGSNYQWFKDGNPLADDAPRLTGTNERVLVFDPVMLDDAGEYVVSYDDGARAVVVTPTYTLHVLPAGALPAAGGIGLSALALAMGYALYRRKRS